MGSLNKISYQEKNKTTTTQNRLTLVKIIKIKTHSTLTEAAGGAS